MSQYTITTHGLDTLRLASVELLPPDEGYTVETGRSRSEEVLVSSAEERCWNPIADVQTVKSGQPLSRIYKIRPTTKPDCTGLEDDLSSMIASLIPAAKNETVLRLVIRYLTIDDGRYPA